MMQQLQIMMEILSFVMEQMEILVVQFRPHINFNKQWKNLCSFSIWNVQMERCMGTSYLKIHQQGALSVVDNSMQYISQKSGFGGWVHCAGMVTPWGTHLGSEEYEPNARAFTAASMMQI